MSRISNPTAELRLRLLFQDERSWLVAELDGAPLPIASLDYDDRLPDDLRFALHTLSGWCREAARPETERVDLEDAIGRTLAGILFTDDLLLRSLATHFPERSGFSPERSFEPDSRNRLRRDFETWIDSRAPQSLRVLIIDEDHPRLAGLPWEMVSWDRPNGPVRLGVDRHFALARLRPLSVALTTRPEPPRPLRVFHVAAREPELNAGDSRLTHHIRRLQESKHETTFRYMSHALEKLPGGAARTLRRLLDTDHLGTSAVAGETCTLLHVAAHGVRPKNYWQGILTHQSPRHATTDTASPEETEEVAHTLTAGALIDGLGDAGLPEVVFLGTCYGTKGEPAEWRRESRRSLGERLLDLGVGAVVGANGGVLTTELPELTRDFYDEIADGASIDRTVQTMRRRLFQRNHCQMQAGSLPPERWWRPMALACQPRGLRPFDVEPIIATDEQTPAIAKLFLRISAGAAGPRRTLVDDQGAQSSALIPSRLWRRLHDLALGSPEDFQGQTATLATGQALLAGRLGRYLERRLGDLAAIGRQTVLRLDLPPTLRGLPWREAWWPATTEAVVQPPTDGRMSPVTGFGVAAFEWPRTLTVDRVEILGLKDSSTETTPQTSAAIQALVAHTPAIVPPTFPEIAGRLEMLHESHQSWSTGLMPALWWDVFDGYSPFVDLLENQPTDHVPVPTEDFVELPPEADPSEDVGHDLRTHLASLAPPLDTRDIANLLSWLEENSDQILEDLRSRLATLDESERQQVARIAVLRGFQPRSAWRQVLGQDPSSLIERLAGQGLAMPRSDVTAVLTGDDDRWLIPRLVSSLCRLEATPETLRSAHHQAALHYVPEEILEVSELAKSAEEERYADAAPGGHLKLSASDWFEARYHWLRAKPEGLEVHWCDRHIERWLVPRQVAFLMHHSHSCIAQAAARNSDAILRE